MLSEPLNMFDAAPLADGAAAVVMARGDVLPDTLLFPRVEIAASSAAISSISVHDRSDPLTFDAAVESTGRVYLQSGRSPADIDLFELHDRYSIFAALALEAAGFAKRGEGWKLAQDGSIALDGKIPICTYGGSKARGEAGGATGLYQAVEATRQLQGRAHPNQVENARTGMIQTIGGAAATVVTHILQTAETL